VSHALQSSIATKIAVPVPPATNCTRIATGSALWRPRPRVGCSAPQSCEPPVLVSSATRPTSAATSLTAASVSAATTSQGPHALRALHGSSRRTALLAQTGSPAPIALVTAPWSRTARHTRTVSPAPQTAKRGACATAAMRTTAQIAPAVQREWTHRAARLAPTAMPPTQTVACCVRTRRTAARTRVT
jgi:hypothetical protein